MTWLIKWVLKRIKAEPWSESGWDVYRCCVHTLLENRISAASADANTLFFLGYTSPPPMLFQQPEHIPWRICPFPALSVLPFLISLIPVFISPIEISANHSGREVPTLNRMCVTGEGVAEWSQWMFPWQNKEEHAESISPEHEGRANSFFSDWQRNKNYNETIVVTITIVSQGHRHHRGEQYSVKMEEKESWKPRYLLLFITYTKLCTLLISCSPKCLLLCD